MSKTIDQEIMAKLLFEKYGKIGLNTTETAEVLGCSEKTLEMDRGNARGIPYTKRLNKAKGQVIYNISTIAKFLVDNEIKVF